MTLSPTDQLREVAYLLAKHTLTSFEENWLAKRTPHLPRLRELAGITLH